MSEHSDERIPVRYRHDAADPGRPLVVVTPAYSVGFGGLVIIAAVLALFWNVFAVLAALAGFICIVSCAPDMLACWRADVLAC